MVNPDFASRVHSKLELALTSTLALSRIPISFPAGATVESGIGAWPDLLAGQHWAVCPAWWRCILEFSPSLYEIIPEVTIELYAHYRLNPFL